MSSLHPQPTLLALLGRRVASWTCLAVIGVLAGCGAGVSPEQKEAMMHLQGLGGKINLNGNGYAVDLSGTPAEDDDLVYLQKIANVNSLNIQGARITDAGLEHLYQIKTLRQIYLNGSGVTREGRAKLAEKLGPDIDLSR